MVRTVVHVFTKQVIDIPIKKLMEINSIVETS